MFKILKKNLDVMEMALSRKYTKGGSECHRGGRGLWHVLSKEYGLSHAAVAKAVGKKGSHHF